MKKLVIVGGGHAHLEVLRQFGLRKRHGVDITLVSPERYTAYSGMLPGLVAGHYTFAQCHIDLQALAAYAGARLVFAHARALDAARRRIVLNDGIALEYDVVSLNVGSVPLAQDVSGVAEYATAIKPVSGFLAAWDALAARGRAGQVRSIAVVGGGAGGLELLLAMHYRLTRSNPNAALDFRLITDTAQLLPQHAGGARKALEHEFRRKRISVHCGMRATRVEANAVFAVDALDRERRIDADAVVWVTGAAAPQWLRNSDVVLNEAKFILINKYLQSTSHASVFAAGDCASMDGVRYPKSGVYAVRQGPVLAENLRRVLRGGGEPLLEYTPQKRALALISTGERHAIASWGAFAFGGDWVWRWKDTIDRAFVAKYRDAPE